MVLDYHFLHARPWKSGGGKLIFTVFTGLPRYNQFTSPQDPVYIHRWVYDECVYVVHLVSHHINYYLTWILRYRTSNVCVCGTCYLPHLAFIARESYVWAMYVCVVHVTYPNLYLLDVNHTSPYWWWVCVRYMLLTTFIITGHKPFVTKSTDVFHLYDIRNQHNASKHDRRIILRFQFVAWGYRCCG